MTGTSIFIWHDGRPLYDEVGWEPREITHEEAYEIAFDKLWHDRRATRVHVDFGGPTFVEAVR